MKKMECLATRLLVATALCGLASLPLRAENYPTGSYTLSPDGLTLTAWTGGETSIDMTADEVLQGITAIGSYAFDGNDTLQSVVLPAGVNKLENGAFFGCSALASITLPEGLTSIGNSAFTDCKSLATIDLPQSLTTLGASVFYGCSSLNHVVLPALLTEIPNGAFNDCTSLTDIDLGNITVIGEEAFDDCTALTTLICNEKLKEIGASAFTYCTALENVTLNAALETIGAHAFESSGLRSIDFTPCTALQSIGTSAFLDCTQLASLVLPPQAGVTFETGTYGGSIFQNTALTEVTIPDSYTEVPSKIFYGCDKLERVVLGSNVETIRNSAFGNCPSLKEVVWNDRLTTIEWNVFAYCAALEKVTLPESVTWIDDWVFSYCEGLRSIELGSQVAHIGQECFSPGCTTLTSVTVKAVTPPELGSYVFNGLDFDAATLYVPAASVADYQTADQWKDFTRIEPLPATGLPQTIEGDVLLVRTTGQGVEVTGLVTGDRITLYTLTGQCVAASTASSATWCATLPGGLYVVAVNGEEVQKVIVR